MSAAIGFLIYLGALCEVVAGIIGEAQKNSPTDWTKAEWPDLQYRRAVDRLSRAICVQRNGKWTAN
jgi:hypothetical protein